MEKKPLKTCMNSSKASFLRNQEASIYNYFLDSSLPGNDRESEFFRGFKNAYSGGDR